VNQCVRIIESRLYILKKQQDTQIDRTHEPHTMCAKKQNKKSEIGQNSNFKIKQGNLRAQESHTMYA